MRIVPAPEERGNRRPEARSTNLCAMAEPHPTIRYIERSGTPVLEVGGTWTVFSMRGLAREAEQARRAARGRGPRTVDASNVKRLDTAGALEILQLAGATAETEVKTADENQAELFKVVQNEHVRSAGGAARELAGSLFEEVGHDIGRSPQADRQSLRLLRRDPGDLRRGLRAAEALSRRRGGAPDARGLGQGAGDRGRALLPDRRGDRLSGRAAAAGSSAPRSSPSRPSASACFASSACC